MTANSGVVDVLLPASSQFVVRFGAGTIVGKEHYERVVVFPGFLEIIDKAADVIVHSVNLSGIHSHTVGSHVAFLFREPNPRTVFPFGKTRLVGNDTEFHHPFLAIVSDNVPTAVAIHFVELFYVGILGLERPVRSVVCKI